MSGMGKANCSPSHSVTNPPLWLLAATLLYICPGSKLRRSQTRKDDDTYLQMKDTQKFNHYAERKQSRKEEPVTAWSPKNDRRGYPTFPDCAAAICSLLRKWFLNCTRSIVPYPTASTNKPVQTLVMMSPVGKIPSVVPGSTKGIALATIAGSWAFASGTVMLTGLLFGPTHIPAT